MFKHCDIWLYIVNYIYIKLYMKKNKKIKNKQNHFKIEI